jgi:hypothetical protein
MCFSRRRSHQELQAQDADEESLDEHQCADELHRLLLPPVLERVTIFYEMVAARDCVLHDQRRRSQKEGAHLRVAEADAAAEGLVEADNEATKRGGQWLGRDAQDSWLSSAFVRHESRTNVTNSKNFLPQFTRHAPSSIRTCAFTLFERRVGIASQPLYYSSSSPSAATSVKCSSPSKLSAGNLPEIRANRQQYGSVSIHPPPVRARIPVIVGFIFFYEEQQ